MSREYRGQSAEEWLGITCPDDCATISVQEDYMDEDADRLREMSIQQREVDAQSGQKEGN